jgi:hypothetical protein
MAEVDRIGQAHSFGVIVGAVRLRLVRSCITLPSCLSLAPINAA